MGSGARLIAALVPFAVTAAGPPPLEPAFDPHDATAAVQHARDSAPPGGTVHLRDHGAPWAVRPLWIRRDDLTVTFAAGVVLLAKRGEFHAPVLSLLAVAGARNVTLRGLPGAGRGGMPTLRMWKQDYANESLYSKAEWRHGLWIGRRKASPHPTPPSLHSPTPLLTPAPRPPQGSGCPAGENCGAQRPTQSCRVEGLRIEASGGDGACSPAGLPPFGSLLSLAGSSRSPSEGLLRSF